MFIDSSKTSLKAVLFAQWQGLAVCSCRACSPHERNIGKHETATEVYKVWGSSVAALWWFESCCPVAWPPGWIRKIIQFPLWMGQSSQRFSLCEERLAIITVLGARKEKCLTSSWGCLSENFVTTVTNNAEGDEKLCKGYGQNKTRLPISVWKFSMI